MREDLRKFYTDPEILQIALSGQEMLKQLIGCPRLNTKGIWEEYMVYSGDTGTDMLSKKILEKPTWAEEGLQ